MQTLSNEEIEQVNGGNGPGDISYDIGYAMGRSYGQSVDNFMRYCQAWLFQMMY